MNAPDRQGHEAVVADLLRSVLCFKEASLVIFRRGALIEFKTDLLAEKVSSFEEEGHRSWQIGAFAGHHCHLDLGAVREVLFDAEPVSCQGGRLNYTVWFCGEEDCGNPYRPTAMFSVALNAPYAADGTPRREIIGQVYKAYDRLRASPLVRGSEPFLQNRFGPAVSICQGIRNCLESRRDQVCHEITNYPTPIPACDVHFNRLIEERARIFQELGRLDQLEAGLQASTRDAAVLEDYIRTSEAVDDETRSRLKTALADAFCANEA